MKNEKLEKLKEDIYKAIDETEGTEVWDEWHINEAELKEKIRFLFWEYEMQGFLDN